MLIETHIPRAHCPANDWFAGKTTTTITTSHLPPPLREKKLHRDGRFSVFDTADVSAYGDIYW